MADIYIYQIIYFNKSTTFKQCNPRGMNIIIVYNPQFRVDSFFFFFLGGGGGGT